MAHSLSAKKRVKQSLTRTVINRARTSQVKTQIKHFEEALKSGAIDKAKEQFKLVIKNIDKVSSTSTVHKNTAARQKSRLAKRLNALVAKTAPSKS